MGYGDVQSINTSSKLPTPNLNLLASQGMTFIDAHSPSSVCTKTTAHVDFLPHVVRSLEANFRKTWQKTVLVGCPSSKVKTGKFLEHL